MVVTCLDLSRAFDSVSYTKLLNTLLNLGVRGKDFKYFQSYLESRKQYIEI